MRRALPFVVVVLGAIVMSASAQTVPLPPGTPTVVLEPIGDSVPCGGLQPNPTHAAWVGYDLGEWYEAVPLSADDPAYCAGVGLNSGILGLPDGVLALCEVRAPGSPDLLSCRQTLIQAHAPTWSLAACCAYDDAGNAVAPAGSVVVNPSNPWQAKCVGCNVLMTVCNGTGTLCADVH